MRVLCVSSLFPPNVIGGAERSAYNLINWLQAQGHECAVLTTAKDEADICDGTPDANGVKIWRVLMPRAYQMTEFLNTPQWKKPFWHLQDHFDPRNARIMRRVLDAFAPDFINIHMLQGVGYNTLAEIARRDIPVCYVLPDLGLACIRMNMFKKGQDCAGHCGSCQLSTRYKLSKLRGLRRLGFCSPSRAILQKLSDYVPVQQYPHASILNANKYPHPTRPRKPGAEFRYVYVGRLHASKGIDILLAAAARLAAAHDISVTVVGGGPSEVKLRESFGAQPWCHFTGNVAQAEVANYIGDADVLCIPSLWLENSPGVVIHALGLGVPVIGSDKGGIPELVRHGENGLLVPPGDVDAWEAAMQRLLQDSALREELRANAAKQAKDFDQDTIGRKIFDFMAVIAKSG
jgi:glycosyltransferase involved in cell wall biosynthesis